jgi:nitrate/nitrite transport system permease protein
VKVSFGAIPGPAAVWTESKNLWANHTAERTKEADFYTRQAERKKDFLANNPSGEWKERKYAGTPTYVDQIITSLKTVFTGFLVAAVIAVPLGILCGLSKVFNTALNPFIQVFKPVSPLAWLPIVMIMVSALYNPAEPMFQKSFISSALTVALCSLWPALINTSLGVAAIDNDYLNVARVLKLGWWKKVRKIVIPSALPLIFTGLRLSLGVGWMVLIAAEMLAQNPGLGKFVWDMFQNGSSQTLAQIMVAVFTIGFIGFFLDRTMMVLQRAVSFDANTIR